MKSLVKPSVVFCLMGLLGVSIFLAACQPAQNTKREYERFGECEPVAVKPDTNTEVKPLSNCRA